MTAHSELKTSLYSKLTSISTWKTNIGNRVYYLRALQNAAMPYCVYSFYADTHSYDSGNNWEEIYIQFSIFDNNSGSTNISTLESNLINLLDGVTLTFTNYTQISFKRLSKRHLLDEDNVWQTILEYRIELEHN